MPWLGVADTNDKPAGSRSVTSTPVAASGPALVRVTVNVITSPTFGVGLLTDLATCRSACCGVSVALATLLPAKGSNWSLWLTAATLVCGTGLTTRTANVDRPRLARRQGAHGPTPRWPRRTARSAAG